MLPTATCWSGCPAHVTRLGLWGAFTAALALLPLVPQAKGADFSVSTPGGTFNFTINNVSGSPSITLVRGETYTFAVATSTFHPFQILSTNVSHPGGLAMGTLSFTVPMVASNYAYRCGVHTTTASLMGTIVTVPPPTVRITRFELSTNIVLRSTGASNYSVLPEFKTDVASTNWFALTVQTNRFLLGTNETICGRPPDGNVFLRVRAQRN